ncbi:glycosyltransferase family 4 protein [Salinisphaera sp. G21_0]|uniref:glycosyltransferase family 4 protein n=1 Tax=Salinisphaera sp. G21_0 TaxID=2821094 RepID=UPI001ADCD257|nr:glycosyltransferase family 4 protein [Salinisphaera sp. G21_0]MBO9480325.1 glycosyltransferase family 4 protein [Salinisphaera sp. G21_0]
MKILIVNRALGTLFGGGESFDYNAALHLANSGHEVTLITGKPLWGEARNSFSNLKVIYVATPDLRRFAYATEKINTKLTAAFYHLDNALFERAVLRWFATLAQNTFDIVQCCSLFGLPQKLLSRYKQPVISWLPGPPSGRVRTRLPQLVVTPLFGLFTHGSPEWSLLEMGFMPGQEFEIIEPGIDLSAIDSMTPDRCVLRKQLGIGLDDLLGITTARLVPVKNHHLLLKGIAAARGQGVIWHWMFVGDGPLDAELKRTAKELGISSQIHFLGHQNQQQVHTWLAIADIFALTSSYESFSIATLEAMAHRLPVIGTDVGYLQVLITEAKAGRVVPSLVSAPLAATLVELAEAANRSGYGQAGRQFVQRLDWPNIAKRLETFYRKVIKGRA